MHTKRIAFYVSGHGYGHSTRAAEVLRSLAMADPEWEVYLRTTAPGHLFSHIPTELHHESPQFDSGVVEEEDTLHINWPATVERVRLVLGQREEIIRSESAFLRREQISLVVADIPYLAGDIAGFAGVPCLGLSNFTWDYIYEPMLADAADAEELLDIIRGGYGKMQALLQLPFHHRVDSFREVIPVPLVARTSSREPEEILRAMDVDPSDSRPRVFLGMRGQHPPRVVEKAASEAEDYLFLHSAPPGESPRNVKRVRLGPTMSVPDVIRVSDVVVSKLGYSIVSECVAGRTSILYPPRRGFREEEILRTESRRHIRGSEIPLLDFEAGKWGTHLRRLMDMPVPNTTMIADGARVCVDLITARFAC